MQCVCNHDRMGSVTCSYVFRVQSCFSLFVLYNAFSSSSSTVPTGISGGKGVIQPYATKGQNKALLSPGVWAVGKSSGLPVRRPSRGHLSFTTKLHPRPLPHEKAPDPMEDAILRAAFLPTLQQVMPTACPVQGQDRKVYGFSSTGGMFGRTGSWVGCSLDPPCRGQQKSTARLHCQ